MVIWAWTQILIVSMVLVIFFLLLLPLNNNDNSYNLFHSCQVPGENTNDFLYSVASGPHNI